MKTIKVDVNPVAYNNNFKLYMTSKLLNPHYLP